MNNVCKPSIDCLGKQGREASKLSVELLGGTE